jgi:hypothetical protein
MDCSWLIERGADSRLVHWMGVLLAFGTFVALAAAALAVLGWLIPGGWWTGLLATGVACFDDAAGVVLRAHPSAW